KFIGVNECFHSYNRTLYIGHFDADGTSSRNRRYNSYVEFSQAQGNVIFQVPDLGNANSFCRYYFIKSNGRSNRGRNLLDGDTIVAQGLNNLLLVSFQLFRIVNNSFPTMVFQKVHGWEFIML